MSTYCGECYYSPVIYSFGFCKDCWIKNGKPLAMDGSGEVIRHECN